MYTHSDRHGILRVEIRFPAPQHKATNGSPPTSDIALPEIDCVAGRAPSLSGLE